MTNKFLLIRHGPAPGDTEDASGNLHSLFTKTLIVPLSPTDQQSLFGDGTATTEPFVEMVRHIWAQVSTPEPKGGHGNGHVLIGSCSDFEYVFDTSPTCGQSELGPKDPQIAPKNYVALFAVARSKKPADYVGGDPAPDYIDLAIDYRGTNGPGDPAAKPIVFGQEWITHPPPEGEL